MQDFGEPPLTRAELEDFCRCSLAAARHAMAELAEDLNEASDTELVERAMLAMWALEPAVPMLLPREQHPQKRGHAFLMGVPAVPTPEKSRGEGAFVSWMHGYRRVTRADITPLPS